MLKSIVPKQKTDRDRLLSIPYVERTKREYAEKWMASDLVKVILGPRRAGKSAFALMLLKGRDFAYFNFDDESVGDGRMDLDELMTELKLAYGDTKYILFDEIQNLPRWELFINRLHRSGYNIVLTGSNAQLLSKELATHLTGRHIPIELLPFSFLEILKAKQYEFSTDKLSVPEEKATFLGYLTRYMTNGGYPEVVMKEVDPQGYLGVLFDAILFKDVVRRHKVRFTKQLADLGSHLMNNVSGQYTLRRLTKILSFKSDVTLGKYLGYLTEAYLLFSLDQHSNKAGMRIQSPKKIYVVDNGLIAAKSVRHSPDNGRLMENLVFIELVKRGFEPNRELFYYKTRNDREVDFVLKKGYKVMELMQVCYDSADTEVAKREIKALVEASGELDVNLLTVLTWDEERTVEKNGKTVRFKPLWKWLLEEHAVA